LHRLINPEIQGDETKPESLEQINTSAMRIKRGGGVEVVGGRRAQHAESARDTPALDCICQLLQIQRHQVVAYSCWLLMLLMQQKSWP
jgi:hypothetical protein